MQQPSPALRQVFSAKHSAIFDFSKRLGLHFAVYISKSRVLLVEINQCVNLNDGVFNQTEWPSQTLMLLCTP